MLEAAPQEMLGAQPPDRGRIGDHVHQARHLGAAVPHHHGGNAEREHLLQLAHVPQDDALQVQRLELGPGPFQPAGFPVERPVPVMMHVISHALQQRAARRTGGLQQESDFRDSHGAQPLTTRAELFLAEGYSEFG